MTIRRTLPARRAAQTMNFDFGGVQYVATLGYFPDGMLGEIFLNTGTKLNVRSRARRQPPHQS